MDRKKTTVYLPKALLLAAKDLGKQLGTGRNAFIALAVQVPCLKDAKTVELFRQSRQK